MRLHMGVLLYFSDLPGAHSDTLFNRVVFPHFFCIAHSRASRQGRGKLSFVNHVTTIIEPVTPRKGIGFYPLWELWQRHPSNPLFPCANTYCTSVLWFVLCVSMSHLVTVGLLKLISQCIECLHEIFCIKLVSRERSPHTVPEFIQSSLTALVLHEPCMSTDTPDAPLKRLSSKRFNKTDVEIKVF